MELHIGICCQVCQSEGMNHWNDLVLTQDSLPCHSCIKLTDDLKLNVSIINVAPCCLVGGVVVCWDRWFSMSSYACTYGPDLILLINCKHHYKFS